MRRALLLPPLMTLIAGCALGQFSDNEPLEPKLMVQLVPGRTTAKQAVELLGAPMQVVQLDKRSAYFYSYTNRRLTGVISPLLLANNDSRSDRMWLFFDETDRLTHYSGTFEGARVRWGFPWTSLHNPDRQRVPKPDLEAEARKAVQPHGPAETPTE